MKVAVDVIVYREDGKILFIERKNEPFKGMFALPGGFVEDDEYIIDAAVREVFEETGISLNKDIMRFVNVYDAPKRDQRERVVSVCYYAEVAADVNHTQPLAFGSDAARAVFLSPEETPDEIAFDHGAMIGHAMEQEIMRDQANLMKALSNVVYADNLFQAAL